MKYIGFKTIVKYAQKDSIILLLEEVSNNDTCYYNAAYDKEAQHINLTKVYYDGIGDWTERAYMNINYEPWWFTMCRFYKLNQKEIKELHLRCL